MSDPQDSQKYVVKIIRASLEELNSKLNNMHPRERLVSVALHATLCYGKDLNFESYPQSDWTVTCEWVDE
jgi:hypothetical protein